MQKFIFILIFIFTAQSCYAAVIKDIENERQKCLDTNFQSDYTMAQCNYAAVKKYNTEINTLIKKFKNHLSEEQYKTLIYSQKQWKLFIKKNNTLLENTLETKFYFEPHLISSNIKFQNYKQRYQELIDLYEYLKTFQ